MIYLITGQPGNGKTLYTIDHVRQLAKKENRPVYQMGINDLKLDWQELTEEQAKRWYELPPGAIIILDEAQRLFRPRPGRGEPPSHVSHLETHRHYGHDLYLITQHPGNIDPHVRRLVGIHRHIVRTFGMGRAVIHEWGEVHLDCEKRRNDSSKTNYSFPKDVYNLYKSAEVHTHRVHLPKQVFYLGGLLIVLLGLLYFLVYRNDARKDKQEESEIVKQIPLSAAPAVPNFRPDKQEKLTVAEYIDEATPRIPGLPHTAPRYDDVTKPVRAPYPAGCYKFKGECKCLTDQGTPITMTQQVCGQVLRHGFYKDWEENASSVKTQMASLDQAAQQPPHRGTTVGGAGAADSKPAAQPVVINIQQPPTAPAKPQDDEASWRKPQVPLNHQNRPPGA